MDTPFRPTFYQDWLERRALLERAPPLEFQCIGRQLRVFDALVKRFKDSPEAAAPARFPVQAAGFPERRAVLLQHGLIKEVERITAAAQAPARVSGVLQRLAQKQNAPEVSAIRSPDEWRAALADRYAETRVRAVEFLLKTRALDDIALLSDILATPPCPNETRAERDALIGALEELGAEALRTQA